jgi:crotonyl-CoA reductase
MVMAAGVNFNNVWAARGVPVDVTKTQARWGEPTDFHIIGSDASGIVYAIGSDVTSLAVGDHVVVHAGQWDAGDPWVAGGNDPGLAASFRVWGYDTCWGSMAQFTKVQAHQCLPKADRLSWEEAAAPTLTGSTAYRMLHGWPPNTVEPGDVVLVWGGAGGLGSLAIQLVALAGGRPVAVVSSEDKVELLHEIGVEYVIDRKAEGYEFWDGDKPNPKEFVRFGKKIRELVGEDPDIVFEHPGRQTFGASVFVAKKGGKVVTCASTSGFMHVYDNRYLWMNLKSIIGSHFANYKEAWESNRLADLGMIHPILSKTYPLAESGEASYQVHHNLHEGKLGILCLAPEEGLGIDDPELREKVGEDRITAVVRWRVWPLNRLGAVGPGFQLIPAE